MRDARRGRAGAPLVLPGTSDGRPVRAVSNARGRAGGAGPRRRRRASRISPDSRAGAARVRRCSCAPRRAAGGSARPGPARGRVVDPGNGRAHDRGRAALRAADQVRGGSDRCRPHANRRQPAPVADAGERRRRDRGAPGAVGRGSRRDRSLALRRTARQDDPADDLGRLRDRRAISLAPVRRSHRGAHGPVREDLAGTGVAPDRGTADRAARGRRRRRDRGPRSGQGRARARGATGRAPGVGGPVSAARGMVPGDLTRIQLVTDPQVSPDGRRIAFVVTTLSEERDEYLSNVWIVDLDGGAPRRFTAGPRRDLEPRWSPDGSWLAFLSERAPKDKLQLYVMPADGGEPTRLTTLDNGVSSVAWSPDGSRVAFVSPVGGLREPDSEEEKRKSRPARVITSVQYRFSGEGFNYDSRPTTFTGTHAGT